ncbi:hydroxyacylglutathione hydrolase [Thiomicrospira microaerophila]|uniref:hydroxyacylglutathione hydrolase n=1 Tax=Thiomicrospira microaerophila TaxID=406020 RepID=UPI00200C1C89|nr:hydroxyacylglutathione hydrolase [Thiomicrospira microaerophila]UQB43296.1 hydroxyacylglutathione hydrolase [Thiomicrospira microaerophila]
MSLTIHSIPAFEDNYIWLLESDHQAWVVDPGQAEPVLAQLAKLGLTLTGILLTHHHYDHTDGVEKLLECYSKSKVYAGYLMQKPYITHRVKQGDHIQIANTQLSVLETPGHTLDHIAFYNDQVLFCGDTLFTGGCGRVFEGSAQQMTDSLLKLRALPDSLSVYCGHEYTLSNMNFALRAEPDNLQIAQRLSQVREKRKIHQACVPSKLKEEKLTNPFLRFDLEPLATELAKRNQTQAKLTSSDLFAICRAWKDQLDKTGELDAF